MNHYISPELVERMVAHFRAVEAYAQQTGRSGPLHAEALRIAALLPKPVDPDMILAREIAGDAMAGYGPPFYASGRINCVRTGNDDSNSFVRAALTGIKRGRELERSKP